MQEKGKAWNRSVLSDRLQAIISMVTAGNRVCDVGCDHGFVPIELVKRGISPKALAMDAKEGPLRQAEEHIASCGLEAYIETRLSDGLRAYRMGEAEALICAGMGGKLMMRILSEDKEKTDSFRELILQPQSELQQFRCFLRGQGYLITDENMIEEDGKFYPMMKAVKGNRNRNMLQQEDREDRKNRIDGIDGIGRVDRAETFWRRQMEDKYGPVLLQRRHPVLYRYLEREKRICMEVLEQLRIQGLAKPGQSRRYEEVSGQLRDCERVMEEMR